MMLGLSFILLIASFFGTGINVYAAGPDVKAEGAILVDADTGKILYEYNADLTLAPASMTKMMTEYLVLEAIDKGKIEWDTKVSISEHVHKISQNRGLSNVPLRVDLKYSVKELYEAMAIYSANGATMALAEAVSGTESKFVEQMNKKAKEMGLTEYKFVNTTGLNNRDLGGNHPAGGPEEENMLSARSTAKLAFRLVKDYPEVLDFASIPEKKFREGTDDMIQMKNWNWMLPGLVYANKYKVEGIDGLKTGSTDLAGYCFTGTAKQGDMRLISVVMNTNSYEARFAETEKLLNYGFNNFEKQTLVKAGYQKKDQADLPVVKGKEKSVAVSSNKELSTVIKKGEKELYKPKVKIDKSKLNEDGALVAPVKKGEAVGKVTLDYKGKEDFGYLYEKQQAAVDLVTENSIEKAGWFTLAMRGIGGFFSGIWTSVADAVKGLF
ncbi:serine hydrolase [Pseudalkalibacillus caeni]|uniref:serine-type D-Ala-D-Ala carboxypeptidase n=1 Tax=Exobacillus caeni TaxID=2574798 RepID=A0A5R9EW42_9BACL|nr:D-alanyl-D-alanine carboxypeptidase [Pseudalkalibacillus caeni]